MKLKLDTFIICSLASLFFIISCSKPIEIEAIKMVKGKVENTISTINSGTVEATNQAELAFGTVGRISKIYITLGSKVETGKILAELENADLKAIYSEALKALSRSEELFKNGLVSTSSLDSAKRVSEVARVNYEKTVMKAPFSGLITSMNLQIGEFYQNNLARNQRPFVQIIDLKKRIIKGEIDEIDLQKVQIGNLARIKIPALNNRIFKALVTKVVPFISTVRDQDRSGQVELEIIESNGILIPVGASADVEIIGEEKSGVNIIASNTLRGTGKSRYVYKITAGKLVKCPLSLGLGNYERYEVISGLNSEDLIARGNSTNELTEGMKVKTKEVKWP